TRIEADLPVNPFTKKRSPVILVPMDILRDLPIAADWSDVSSAAAHNAALRARVNDQIAKIWSRRSKQDKDEMRRWALSNRASFEIFLDMLRGASPKAYDFVSDPLGILIWYRIASKIARDEPLNL